MKPLGPLDSSFRLHPSAFAFLGAGDEIRTRDPQLGRLMLYQLSYTRPFKDEEGRRKDEKFTTASSLSSFILPTSSLLPGAGGRIRTYVRR